MTLIAACMAAVQTAAAADYDTPAVGIGAPAGTDAPAGIHAPASIGAPARQAPVPAQPLLDFSLPALPLHDALQRYSALAGRSVLYDALQVAGRRSAPVRGRYTPDEALRRLLDGTGIVPRHATHRAVSLAPVAAEPSAPPAAGVAADAARRRFYGRLQMRILQALCARPDIEVGSYRLALRLRIDDIPAISGLQVHATGRPELEPLVHAALSGLAIGAAPPRGFAQPVTMLITPEAAQRYGACPS